MKILIVEKDEVSVKRLKGQLNNWYVVEGTSSSTDAEQLIYVSPCDLMIINSTLADKSGIELLTFIRKEGFQTPILVLSYQTDLHSKVTAFNAGCDDYLCRPFHSDELLVRIRALLRRSPQPLASHVLKTGELTLDAQTKKVTRAQTSIQLRKKEYLLLEYMMRNAGRVITREMLLDNVWDTANDSLTNVVDVHIKQLRRKIDVPFSRKMIKTVYGFGYRLEP